MARSLARQKWTRENPQPAEGQDSHHPELRVTPGHGFKRQNVQTSKHQENVASE